MTRHRLRSLRFLRQPRFALALLVATLVILALSTLVFVSFRAKIAREVQATLIVIAEQKRDRIEHWLARGRTDAASYFAGTAQVPMLLKRHLEGEPQSGAVLAQMRDRMAEIAQAIEVSGMAVLDRTGAPIASHGTVELERHAATIRGLLERPRIEMLDLSRNARGEVELGLLAPVSSRDGAPLGIVYLVWQASRSLDPLVSHWPIPTHSADTFLVRPEGANLLFLTPTRYAPQAALTLTAPLTAEDRSAVQAVQGAHGILDDTVDYRGVRVLAYATPIAGTPWLMIAKIDRSEAYAGVWLTAWVTATSGALVLLLIGAAALLLQRQMAARQAGERRLGALIEQGLTGYAEADLTGRLTRVNDRYCEIVGQPRAVLLGRHLSEFTPPADWEVNRAVFERLLQGPETSTVIEKRYRRQGGGLTHAQVAIALLRDGTRQPVGYLALVADLTARVQAEHALQAQTASLQRINDEQRAIYDAATVGIALARDRIIERCNRTMETLFGYAPGELVGQSARVLYADEATYLAFGERFHAALAQQGHYREELEMVRKDGSTLWVRVSTVPLHPPDLSQGLAGTFEDISVERAAIARFQDLTAELERKVAARTVEVATANRALQAANAELAVLATTDALTGVRNRRDFEQTVATEMARARRYGVPLSLLLIDIDRFKAVNDRYGHETGDQVLTAMARLMRESLRSSDLLARWGGEEFTVLLPHCDQTRAMNLAERLRARVAAWPFPGVGRVTISVGVAQYRDAEALQAWFQRVDRALYAAKGAGRDRVSSAPQAPAVPRPTRS